MAGVARPEGWNIYEEVDPTREIDRTGPFDIIGDVHGCYPELTELLERLGYRPVNGRMTHPEGRLAVFLGDITDRGPDSVACMSLVVAMVRHGEALYVPGNHCRKLYRYMSGRNVVLQHGIETTAAELRALSDEDKEQATDGFRQLYEDASYHLLLDGGRLVVAHAGIRHDMIGRTSKRIMSFCLFGDTTGERTADGLPVRRDWAQDYDGDALIVYGHTPIREAIFRYNTINIDQGCVFGGALTALRYPERKLVHVQAREEYDSSGVFVHLEPEPGAPG